MSRKSFEVTVEPEILLWARKSLNISEEEVAKKLKTSVNSIEKMELGEKKPTITQLRSLSKIYKRPLAAFLLSEPPNELPPPGDFRLLPEFENKPLTKNTLLAIRRARRLQSLACDLSHNIERDNSPRLFISNATDDPEVISIKARKLFNVTLEEQFGWRNENEAYGAWRKEVEKQGIFVFQMNLKEARGFSLTHDEYPVIVVSTSDSTRGKIFSLFHEYAHLIIDKAGICDMEDVFDERQEKRRIEKFCNHFAGAFLVPKNGLVENNVVIRKNNNSDWSDMELSEIGKAFKVSREVILRRLVINNLAENQFYRKKKEEWKSKEIVKKKGGRRNPSKECISKNGERFVSLVLDNHNRGMITYRDVSDYLGIRAGYIQRVEKIFSA